VKKLPYLLVSTVAALAIILPISVTAATQTRSIGEEIPQTRSIGEEIPQICNSCGEEIPARLDHIG